MANPHPPLTNGACLKLMEHDAHPEGFQPVLQCLSVKKIGIASAPDRYRIIMSDGDHFIQSMLVTKLNGLVESGALTRNSIFTLKSTVNTYNSLLNKRLLIILQIGEDDVTPCVDRIGAPVSLESATNPTVGAVTKPASGSAQEPSLPSFPALPGMYLLIFLYVEPLSTLAGAFAAWFLPGAAWFHHQLVPSFESVPVKLNNVRDKMAIWQLANCYFLLSLCSWFVLKGACNYLKHDPPLQEHIVHSFLVPLAIADVTHIIVTLIVMPQDVIWKPLEWNGTTHGNITFTMFLFLMRIAWLAGVGRTVYHTHGPKSKKS